MFSHCSPIVCVNPAFRDKSRKTPITKKYIEKDSFLFIKGSNNVSKLADNSIKKKTFVNNMNYLFFVKLIKTQV